MVEDTSSDLQIVDENGQPVDWQNDPNEPRYCLCNQVSYGDMVGCDNDDVSPLAFFFVSLLLFTALSYSYTYLFLL